MAHEPSTLNPKDQTMSAKAAKLKLKPPADPDARRVYWLDHMIRELEDGTIIELDPGEEVAAVAFAKCSRSDTPFDQNVWECTEESAGIFNKKWVVGFGHGSVAEHAHARVAIENVSQVVVKIVEDARLASFTEKSSRYQIFSDARCVIPKRIQQSRLLDPYRSLMHSLYETYFEALRRLDPLMRSRYPNATELPDKAYAAQIKARSCDVARYLLPSAAMASLGVTANARTWLSILKKLLSSPHDEARTTGQELLEILRGAEGMDPDEALKEKPLPTLLEFAAPNPYAQMLPGVMEDLARQAFDGAPIPSVAATPDRRAIMLQDDEFADLRVAAALLTKNSDRPFAAAMEALRVGRNGVTPQLVISRAMEARGPYDPAPREFEHAKFMHEIVMDYGGWRDIQRHRMCTPLNQTLEVNLGYDMPSEIAEVGLEREYHSVMSRAAELHRFLCDSGLREDAEYAVPMGYRRRMVVSWNLRELFHFIELRSGPKGHPSYRHIAQELWRTLDATHHELARHIRVDLSATTVSTVGAKPQGV